MSSNTSQFAALEKLMSDEGQRVRRVQRRFWIVTGTAFTLFLILVFLTQTQTRTAPASQVPADAQSTEMAQRPSIDERLARSPLMRELIDSLIAAQLESSVLLESKIADSEDAIRAIVQETLDENHVPPPPTLTSAEIEREIERRSSAIQADFQARFYDYENRLSELAANTSSPATSLDFGETQTQLDDLRSYLENLAVRVDCAVQRADATVQTYILNTQSSNAIGDGSIVITLGPLARDQLETVSIGSRSEPGAPATTKVTENLAIGSSIGIEHDGESYQISFTSVALRLLNSALVGFELRSQPAGVANCDPVALGSREAGSESALRLPAASTL